MRSPAAAIAWEFGRRHRWGLAALAIYFALLAALRLLVLGPGGRIVFAEGWQFALVVVVPLAATFAYLLAVFTFGLEGDLAARRSIYPRRMFTLPVTTAALAGWPMLFGGIAMAGLWLSTRLLAPWPAGTSVPTLWPALFAATFLAWMQGLAWMPYPLPGLRVIVAVGWLSAVGFIALLGVHLQAPDGLMMVLLAPQLPLAYWTARRAVALARCGEGLETFGRPRRVVAASRSQGSSPFASPVRAQLWFEARRSGHSLPLLVAMVLPFELLLLFAFGDAPNLLKGTVVAVLLTPPLMASFVTAFPEFSPFLATRPLSTANLVGAKLVTALRSTGIAWLLVLAALTVALILSGRTEIVTEGMHHLADSIGTARAVVLSLLLLFALMVSTWKRRIEGFATDLWGRPGLVRARVFGTLALLTTLVFWGPWILRSKDVLIALVDALPWILGVLACGKVAVGAWIATALANRELLSERALLLGALAWSGSVLALHGLLVWLLPALLFPAHLLAFVAILAVPGARIAAAVLALSWNRHR